LGENVPQIIQDSFSEAGEEISSDQFRRLEKQLLHISSIPNDPENAVIPRDTIISLKKGMNRLIVKIDRINNHIKEILRNRSIFDYEDNSIDESEFYHG
jgi:hypothetical protein